MHGQIRVLQHKQQVEKILAKKQTETNKREQGNSVKSGVKVNDTILFQAEGIIKFFQQNSTDWAKKAQNSSPPPPAKNTATPAELTDILIKYGNNPDGIPSLLYAAKMGDLPAVTLLIEHGASPLTRDAHGHTALHFALFSRNFQMVEFFLTQGIDPNAGNYGQAPMWYEAMAFMDTKTFQLLVDHGLKLNSDHYNPPYYSPGVLALQYGNLDILRLTLSSGGNLPQQLYYGKNLIVSTALSRPLMVETEMGKWNV